MEGHHISAGGKQRNRNLPCITMWFSMPYKLTRKMPPVITWLQCNLWASTSKYIILTRHSCLDPHEYFTNGKEYLHFLLNFVLPQENYLWIEHLLQNNFQTVATTWWLVCQKQISRAGTRNYIIPQYLWDDVITCPCPGYILLVHTSSHMIWGQIGITEQISIQLWNHIKLICAQK